MATDQPTKRRPSGAAPHDVSFNMPGVTIACAVILVLLTFAVFWPAVNNDFVNWDDEQTIVLNPHFRGLGSENLRWMFTTFHTGHWQPLSWITFALNAEWAEAAYGNPIDPRPYHLTNNIIHAINALLVYLLALRLFRIAVLSRARQSTAQDLAFPVAAAIAALSFAIHPLRVESVAWATERRDVLSAMFFIATLLCYVSAVDPVAEHSARSRRVLFALAIALAAIGLLAKPIGVVLPAIMLVLDVYPLRRLSLQPRAWLNPSLARVLIAKLPFVILAIIGSITAIGAQRAAGAMLEVEQLGAGHRLYVMMHGFAFYPLKTFAPWNLCPLYEIPYDFSLGDASFIWSALIVTGFTIVAIVLARRVPSLLAAWTACLILVLPVSGLFQSGPQLAADRYSYLACIGFALLLGGAALRYLARASNQSIRTRLLITGLISLAVLAALAVMTVEQISVWRDSVSLWNAVIARRPNTSLAYMNRGVVHAQRSELAQAQQDLERSLELWPDEPAAMNNLASVLAQRGNFAQCEQIARRIVELYPQSLDGRLNLGFTLLNLNQIAEAVDQYKAAFDLDPSRTAMMFDLAQSLARLGHVELALDVARHLAAHRPNDPEAQRLVNSLTGSRAN